MSIFYALVSNLTLGQIPLPHTFRSNKALFRLKFFTIIAFLLFLATLDARANSEKVDTVPAGSTVRLATPCYVFGAYQGSTVDAFVSTPGTSSAGPWVDGLPQDSIGHLATHGQIGSTWGVAYNPNTNILYTSAFIKRHVALGPGGTGAIYQIDPTGVTPPSVFVDLNALFGANTAGADPHPYGTTALCPDAAGGNSNFACWFNDVNAWVPVGRQGLGDLDISEDGQFLFVMNMTNKTLYKIPTTNPTAANITLYPFPASLPGSTLSCYWDPNLAGYGLTTSNVGGTGQPDARDNDGTMVSAVPTISYVTGDYGQNDHTLDLGFRAGVCAISVVSALPTACNPATNTYDLAVTVSYSNQPSGDVTLGIGGSTYTVTPDGTSQDTYTITGLISDGVLGIDVSATFVGDISCTDTLLNAYDAPAHCISSCVCYQHYKATSTSQNATTYATWQDAIHEVPDYLLDFETYALGVNINNQPLGTAGYTVTFSNLNGGAITTTDNVASSPPIGTVTPMVAATANTNEGDDSRLTFEVPVDYVGFEIIDLDDVTKTSLVTVVFSDNSTCSFSIDHTLDNCQCEEFLGIVAPPNLQISSVTIYPNTGSRYGVDNIRYGYNATCPVQITNVAVGSCSGTNVTVDVTVDWSANASSTDSILVTIAGDTQIIDLASATAPTVLQFTLPGDGSINNLVTASLAGSCGCVVADSFNLPACTLPCSVAVTSAVPSACNSSTNTYSLGVTVTYGNPPTGDINISVGGTIYTFTPDGMSSDTYTVSNLPSSGTTGIDVSATFVNDSGCTHTLVDAYNAPASCAVVCPTIICVPVMVVRQ